MATDEITTGQLLIVEYERLKDEQKNRIGFRDNLIYATLATMAAVIAATMQQPTPSLLLLLPPASVLLGWTYLVNDEKITSIGRYVREHITPRLAAIPGVEPPVLEWEIAHRTDPRRRIRKGLQLAVDLTTFCGAPLATLTVFWADAPSSSPLIALSIAETASVVGLAAQMGLYAKTASA